MSFHKTTIRVIFDPLTESLGDEKKKKIKKVNIKFETGDIISDVLQTEICNMIHLCHKKYNFWPTHASKG